MSFDLSKLTKNPFGRWDSKVNPDWLFYEMYKVIPHTLSDLREYKPSVVELLDKEGALLIENNKTIENKKPKSYDDDDFDDVLYGFSDNLNVLYWHKDCLIKLSGAAEVDISVYHLPGKSFDLSIFKDYLIPVSDASVSLLMEGTSGGLVTKSVSFEAPVIHDLDLNYGTGFTKEVHEPIVAKLNKDKSGLVLLTGISGSGKSTYIKHLTSIIDRPFIFIPVGMAESITSPSFLRLLSNSKNSILVLEDAESALNSREENLSNSSCVSSLLNICDGFLGDCLKISVICTCNFNHTNIDTALLRRGRLLYKHNFSALSTKDAQRMVDHLGINVKIDQPISLAEIYNYEESVGSKDQPKKSIGFLS